MSFIVVKLKRIRLSQMVCLLVAVALTGCGLAMNSADRLARAEKAYAEGEYRAAIIDAKNILLEEPDNVGARLVLGKASVKVGDAASADKELTRALKLGADPASCAIDLGRALLMLGHYDRIIDEIRPELAANDEDLRAIYQLNGDALLGLGRPVDARDTFAHILAGDEGNIDAQLGVVASYIREDNLGQARATLDQVLTFGADAARPWLVSGDLHMRTGNAAAAEKDFDRSLALAREQVDTVSVAGALAGLADAQLAQGEIDAAKAVSKELTAQFPQTVAAMQLSARIAYLDKDWNEAQEILQTILQQAPDYRPAKLMLGSVHLQRGNLKQAEMYLSALVAANSQDVEARNLLAQTRLRQRNDEAVRELLSPIVDDPNTLQPRTLGLAAQASANLGDFDQAIEYIRRVVDADPRNVNAQLDLAAAYLMANRIDDARSILAAVDTGDGNSSTFRKEMLSIMSSVREADMQTALQKARSLRDLLPEDFRVHAILGSVEMLNGDADAARASFEQASKISPNNPLPLRLLGYVDESRGSLESAAKNYSRIVDLNANDLPALMSLARLAGRAGDYEAMRGWLEKAVAANPPGTEPRQKLGELLLYLRDFPAAKKLAESAIVNAADDASAYRLLGHALLNLGDTPGALDSFEKSVALDPDDSANRLGLAAAQVASGDPDLALQSVQAAYERDPTDMQVAVLLASVRANSGDLDGAEAVADRLQSKHPESAVPLALQAELLARRENLAAAVSKYDQVLAVSNTARYAARAYQIRNAAGAENKEAPLIAYLEDDPDNTEVRLFLAQAYQAGGRDDRAVTEYQRVLEGKPENSIALNNLAWIYFSTGDRRAEDMARRAYQVAPGDGSVVDTLGWVLLNNGSTEEGLKMLRSAAELSPNNGEIRYHLAVGLSRAGDVQQAKRILEELLASNVRFTSSRDAAELLSTL